jgi:steroid Delta-isomerase
MTKKEIEKRLEEYRESLRSMETERWVSEFAEDARIEDPVGRPPIIGRDQLRIYFNKIKEKVRLLDMTPEFTVVSPPEAVVKFTGQAISKDESKVNTEGISTYKFRDDGKLLEMRAFVVFRQAAQ